MVRKLTSAPATTERPMIRIDRGPEVDGPLPTSGKRHGVFRYSCAAYGSVEGFSRQPLLDACRQLKSLYGLNTERAELFREGRDTPDLTCSVEVGASDRCCRPRRE